MVFKQKVRLGCTKDPSGTTYRIKVLQFPHGRMVIFANKETIPIGPPARCARHDTTLPGHIITIVVTLGNMFQPSYLTEVQI